MIVVLFSLRASSQSEIKVTNPGVSVNDNGNNTPDPSAVLDVNSNSKGVMFPRLTEAERDAITDPGLGLLVFNLDICAYQYWNGRNWINVGDFMTLTPPPVPANFSATSISQSEIELLWSDPSNDETGFEIHISQDGINFDLVASTDENIENYTVSNLIDGTEYFFQIRAINGCAKGEFSSTVSAITHYDFGNGLKTDGHNDYAIINISPNVPFGSDTYSFSFWVRQNSLKGGLGSFRRFLFFLFNNSTQGLNLDMNYNRSNDGEHTIGLGVPGQSNLIYGTYNDTVEKVNIIITVNDTASKIYINGVYHDVGPMPGFSSHVFNRILIGQLLPQNHPDLTYGEILCVKGHEFTQAEVDKVFNNGNGSRYIRNTFSNFDLLFDFRFDEASGNIAYDSGPNAFHLPLTNFSSVDAEKWVTF